MELRWTREAAADLERISNYLFQHVPDRAADLVRAVYDAPALLLEFPHRGRPGKRKGRANWYSHRCRIWSSTRCVAT